LTVHLFLGLCVLLTPTDIETVHVAPMSHTDIGFTAPPRTVAERAGCHLDQALKLARRDADFVWNFEVFCTLDRTSRLPDRHTQVRASRPLRIHPPR
jgi:hypothetical protein